MTVTDGRQLLEDRQRHLRASPTSAAPAAPTSILRCRRLGGRAASCASRGAATRTPTSPGLYIHEDFTIGDAVPPGAFQCGPQFANTIHINGPDGHLSKVGAGTMNFNDLDVAGGTLSVASGQTFVFANTYAQSAGVTEIASGRNPSGPADADRRRAPRRRTDHGQPDRTPQGPSAPAARRAP